MITYLDKLQVVRNILQRLFNNEYILNVLEIFSQTFQMQILKKYIFGENDKISRIFSPTYICTYTDDQPIWVKKSYFEKKIPLF